MEEENLYEAAISGDTNAIEKLREKANRVNVENKSILHTESTYGNTENVQFILKEFGNNSLLFGVDSDSETALHLAAYYGHTEVVKVLIDHAARSLPFSAAGQFSFVKFIRKANMSINTALHLAVRNHSVDIVKLLVEADPTDKHIKNKDGDSPVYLAAKRGYNDIVKLICKTCTAPDLEGPFPRTALHVVIKKLHEAEKDDVDVVKVLIDAARRSFSAGGDGLEAESKFYEFVARKTDDDCGDEVFHLAVRGNHLNVVNLLLDEHAGWYNSENRELKRPIYIAAERGYKDIVKLLCKMCFNMEYYVGPQGESVLHAAVRGRDTDCVRFILERAPRIVTMCDSKGWTPLHHAAYYRFDSVLDIIVKTQVSVRYQCVYGEMVPTPLCVAAQEEHTSTVIHLMRLLPASCATADYEGRNIMHFAAMKRNKEMIRSILKHCPPNYIDRILNYKDCDGNTPLHLLIRQGCFVPQLLKHKGVDPMAKNNQNWTALDMLYFDDFIVADQLLIKELLDDTQANDHGKSSTQESLVPPSKRSRKDREFKITKEKLMKQGLEMYKERTSTQIVVTALITTVAFTVGFTMPGGYIQSGQDGEGSVVLSKKKTFHVFMVADALALVLSSTSLFLYFISTMYQDPHQVSKLNAASTGLNIVSVIAMMLTFITGTYVVLSDSPALAISVCVIGCIFFLIVIVLSFKMVYDRRKVEKVEV